MVNGWVVNAGCGPKGYLEVELSDADDEVVPGYERSACETFREDLQQARGIVGREDQAAPRGAGEGCQAPLFQPPL